MFECYDVVVAGGGISGVGAALAAAKLGAKVLLVEKTADIGGRLRTGLDWLASPGRVPEGFAAERPMEPAQRVNQWRQDLTEAGVSLLTHAYVTDAFLQDGVLLQVTALTREGQMSLAGRVYVDATGVGDLAHVCHVPSHTGGDGDGKLLLPWLSMVFQGVNTILSRPEEILPELQTVCPELTDLRLEPLPQPGYLRVQLSADLCPHGLCAMDMTRAENALRGMQEPLLRALTAHGLWDGQLVAVGEAAVFMEGRHALGRHCLDREELIRGIPCEDAVVLWQEEGKPCTIPYRCMLPLRTKNLLLTGRSIAGSRDSLEITGEPYISMALGEAAGIAAALALEQGGKVRRVSLQALVEHQRALHGPNDALTPAAAPEKLPPLPVEGDLMASLQGLLDTPPSPAIAAPDVRERSAPPPVMPSSQLWETLPGDGEAGDGEPYFIPEEALPWW